MMEIPEDLLAWHEMGHGFFLWCNGVNDPNIVPVSWEYICFLFDKVVFEPGFLPGASPQYVGLEHFNDINAKRQWVALFGVAVEPIRSHTLEVYDGDDPR